MTEISMRAGVHDGGRFETVRYPGDEVLLRVTTPGNVQVVEYTSVDREGPPPHTHEWDEVEYVIEGDVEFFVGGRWIPAGPGSVQMLPAGEAHSVRVPFGRARVLMITMGAPFDGFSRELGKLYATGGASLEHLVEVANRFGVRLADG